ncbi:unnamed protein product [Ostreobium quekettii]|uniref:Flavodoxin-like domain-containing protein n=1 Tax=Ostreobium quekettii TaxID=121088 RepID=A0A8S1J5W4_9CHLO|nr:unnamed protein product [Ostreobium quekettii]|eukprot:evm.model.scf_122.8 EVM.evm.TU.scf_122.8   scf_122:42484-50099(-)
MRAGATTMALVQDLPVGASLRVVSDAPRDLPATHGRPAARSGFHARHPAPEAPKASRSVSVEAWRSQGVWAATTAPTVEEAPPPPPTEAPKVNVDNESVLEVTDNVFCVRGTCTERLKFEVQYGLKRGTADNSYLIKGNSKETTVLIDVPYQDFADKYMTTLNRAINLGSIGKIVMTTMHPKCIPTLRRVLEGCTKSQREPRLQVHMSKPAIALLQETLGEDEKGTALLESVIFVVASPTAPIKLDDGQELEFIRTGTSRWPDMVCVYYRAAGILFTSKLVSAHVAPTLVDVYKETPFDIGGWSVYGGDWKYYYDCMLAPVATQVAATFDKLDLVATRAAPRAGLSRALKSFGSILLFFGGYGKRAPSTTAAVTATGPGRQVSILCPRHGPLVRVALQELLRKYEEWTLAQTMATYSVLVMYASAYGNTAALAQAISRGITKAGVGVQTLNLEVAEPQEISDAISKTNGFVMGSPTLGGHMPTQVQSALGTVLRESRARQLPCGVFGSFGWSGEAVDEIEQKLMDAGFSFAFDSIRVKFKPTMKDLQICEESGTDLAQALQKKLKGKARSAAVSFKSRGASGAAQALARVVGSLCVLTAKEQNAQSAMLASWISQGSFDPPGITVAAKKDRALENFLTNGNRFVVNILAEGKEKGPMKQMLKPFKPGQDRFEGMETKESEKTGCVILPDAAAYLECTVAQRMEAGDHWIVYATVDGGKVQDDKALSAVHHRKTATNY